MGRAVLVALGTGAVISSVAALGIGAAVTSAPRTLSRAQYEAAMADIDALRPALRARCEALTGPDEELCRAQTAAAEMVRVAALEESFRRTPEAAKETQRARIEARYQVARAKCAALGGSQRDSCMISVHATKGRSLLEAQAPYLLRQPE